MYRDRTDAGKQLARLLRRMAGPKPLVLALPRGGVLVGAAVARALGGELDVVLVKKLRAPGNPELALGAVCEEGRVFLNDEVVRVSGAADEFIERERRARLAEMQQQRARYRAVRPRAPVAGRTVVLVDDGLATGATMIAAAQTTRLALPARLIVAAPVGPPETVEAIRALPEVDEVVCPLRPEWFAGVGQFYEDFPQIEDDEVTVTMEKFA
jgi:predicted phosphoribosyltransferase